jgi:hypothetical protein
MNSRATAFSCLEDRDHADGDRQQSPRKRAAVETEHHVGGEQREGTILARAELHAEAGRRR